jgi:predicted metal-binding membrane protein
MGNGAGTIGMSFVAFVVMWTAMMAAMMFPSVAPVAILWRRSIVCRLSGLARFRGSLCLSPAISWRGCRFLWDLRCLNECFYWLAAM